MSTSYFLLSTPKASHIADISEQTVIEPSKGITYLLPKNLMTCYINDGLFESRMMEWCKQFCKKGFTFLDIGAHTGTYSLSLSPFVGHVYAFEPQKMTYYALCGGVALSNRNNITCLNVGLGSEEQVGFQTLNIVSTDGGGSTIQDTDKAVLREEKIEIKTLDSLDIRNICFVKIDVEENELNVLKGAKNTLIRSALPHILFECNRDEYRTELFSFLNEMHYNITSIHGVANMFLAHVS